MPNTAAEPSLLGKIATFTELLAKDPHSTAFVSLSDIYRRMGLLEDALEVVEKGVKALPRFSPGYVMLGRLRLACGALEEAAAAFETALSMDEENLAASKGLAQVLIRLGKRGARAAGSTEGRPKLLRRMPERERCWPPWRRIPHRLNTCGVHGPVCSGSRRAHRHFDHSRNLPQAGVAATGSESLSRPAEAPPGRFAAALQAGRNWRS